MKIKEFTLWGNMRKRNLIVAGLISCILLTAGCDYDTKSPNVEPPYSGIDYMDAEFKHVEWIQEEDLYSLFQKIDIWITMHPNKEVINVEIVNASRQKRGYKGYTVPSGALIVYR